MSKPVMAIAALVISACTASAATAHDTARFPAALGAMAAAQYGGGWRPGPGWDRDIDVRCASSGYGYQMCQVDTGMGSRVELVRQTSNTRCIEGQNWGWNRAGVWVNQGCAGIFRVSRRWAGGPGPGPVPGPGPGWNQRFVMNCGSPQHRYAFCQVDVGARGRVMIQRQTSRARCAEGQTWGWNRAGVWVDRGCSADFLIDRRW